MPSGGQSWCMAAWPIIVITNGLIMVIPSYPWLIMVGPILKIGLVRVDHDL